MSNEGKLAQLTPRQLQVLDLLDRGASLKIAASALGISQARVNQLVRDLKDRLGAQSKFDLVQYYRAQNGTIEPYTKDRYLESLVGFNASGANPQTCNTAGEFVFSDVQSFVIEAPWEEAVADPPVVPEALDGQNAKVRRLIAMILLAILIVMAIGFAAVTGMTVTQLWTDFGSISDEKRGPAD